MKKKLMMAVFVLLALGIAGFFVLAANADRFRPVIAQNAEKILGHPVAIEKITVGWHGGIAFELNGVTVGNSARVEKITAAVKILPLLTGDLQAGSVELINPSAHLIRRANGAVDLEGITPLPQPEGPPVAFLVQTFKIRNAVIRFTDESMNPPFETTVKRLDVTVRNLSLTRPMEFWISAALFADDQNFKLHGQFSPREGMLELKEARWDRGGGFIAATGTVRQLQSKSPESDLTLNIQKLELASLFPAKDPSQPSLRGELTTKLQLKFRGTEWTEISKSLSGQGRLQLANGKISQWNVLNELFGRINLIPGLTDRLLAALPAAYQQKLQAKETVIRSVDLQAVIQDGVVSFQGLKFSGDGFSVSASGRVGLDGAFSVPAQIRLDRDFSASVVKSVEELKYLADSGQQLVFPVTLQGRWPGVSVLPDISALASKITPAAAQEIVGGLLQKFIQKNLKKEGGS